MPPRDMSAAELKAIWERLSCAEREALTRALEAPQPPPAEVQRAFRHASAVMRAAGTAARPPSP